MSLLSFQRRAKQQIQEHVSSLLALVRKQTSACKICPCECHECLHQAENRIVGETTEKYGYCGCNVRLVVLKVHPDYQQREERVIAQILYRKLPRLFALVSKTTLESYASSKATFQKELGIVAERAYTNWHCTCYARILNFSVHPDHQQDGLNVEKLLLKWFIQAAEQEGVPMYATTTSSLALGWVDLCMDT